MRMHSMRDPIMMHTRLPSLRFKVKHLKVLSGPGSGPHAI